jgi:ubiquinone/menaquinone biosynthesis C-methylase UbiE
VAPGNISIHAIFQNTLVRGLPEYYMSKRTPLEHNIDQKTIEGFGDEWERFDQSGLAKEEHEALFQSYFSIFPWYALPKNPIGFDLGCGSGRWAMLAAPRVGLLHCIEPSVALDVARKNLTQFENCEFHRATVDSIPLEDKSMDFGYSLGVLHHVPDTQAGITACVRKLKLGAPFLIYLYYAFDNRPSWFKVVWSLSDALRRVVSRFPHGLRYFASQIIAFLIYWPLARFARIMDKAGFDVGNFPLRIYMHRSFYTMRTDALDRFGTRLEQRFSREEIKTMMEKAGLERIEFSSKMPFWCAVGYRCV